MSQESERIAEFQSITGTSNEEARYHLEAHSWDLSSAIMTFFDGNQSADEDPTPQFAPPPHQPSAPMVPMGGMDEDDDEPPWQPMMPPRQSST
jgi:hypothetical protein